MSKIKYTHTFNINQPVEILFPLFSAEGEKLWVPGWDYKNITSSTELHEDYIFLTENHDHKDHSHTPTDAIWLVKRYQPESYLVQFYKVEPEDKVGIITVQCKATSTNATQVEVSYEYIGLSETGNTFVAGFTAAEYKLFITEWKNLLITYFEAKKDTVSQTVPIDPAAIAVEIADLFASRYVLPEIAKRVAYKLRSYAAHGRYAYYVGQPQELADIITKDLKELSGDKHVNVDWVEDDATAADWIHQWLNDAPSNNYGIKKVAILEGNIGYIAISSFYPLAISAPSIKAAMTLIAHTQGLIIDLSNNGGGDESSSNAIIATLVADPTISPLFIESRNGKDPLQLPIDLEWQRYPPQNKCVIIINKRTFSAPEAIAFALQEAGRAVIIGSKSGGGAHMTESLLTVSGGFKVSIPDQRPIGRLSGRNWEGRGVVPDIESDENQVIKTALAQF